MKKKLAGLVAAMMVLAVGTTAFASPEAKIKVDGAVDKTGQKVDVTVETNTNTAASSEKAAEVAETINNNANEEAAVVGVVNVVPPAGYTVSAANPLTITFAIPEVKSGEKIIVLHWNGQRWENASVSNVVVANGSVTATFTNLSPVAFVRITEKATAPSGSGDNGSGKPTSPPGGETAPILPILAIVCLAGVVVCGKKVKFNA